MPRAQSSFAIAPLVRDLLIYLNFLHLVRDKLEVFINENKWESDMKFENGLSSQLWWDPHHQIPITESNVFLFLFFVSLSLL
jgi:hypothetical protein